jgi:hypothetical protein
MVGNNPANPPNNRIVIPAGSARKKRIKGCEYIQAAIRMLSATPPTNRQVAGPNPQRSTNQYAARLTIASTIGPVQMWAWTISNRRPVRINQVTPMSKLTAIGRCSAFICSHKRLSRPGKPAGFVGCGETVIEI